MTATGKIPARDYSRTRHRPGPTQVRVLDVLRRARAPLAPKDVARRAKITQSQARSALEGLWHRRYIVRTGTPYAFTRGPYWDMLNPNDGWRERPFEECRKVAEAAGTVGSPWDDV